MPVLEDGLSSGHASDTENNNPNSISMQKDQHREIVDVNEKYIDSSLDNPQTTSLISAIQTSVGNNQQKPPPRNSIALGYGISVDNDEVITSNNVAPMKNNKETSLINNAINASAVSSATSPSMIPTMTGMTNASHINTPGMNVAPNNASSVPSSAVNQLLNNQKRNNQQPNSNNLTNFLTSSQLPMMSSPNSHERELKDVTNHIIQNNITNSSRQQASSMGMNKKGDIDLDSLYSTLSKEFK